MTQSIVIQVGQCGNQIGCRFWDLALQEHAQYSKLGSKDDSWKSFFRHSKSDGLSDNLSESIKARAVLVDMEEGVINQVLKGPLSKLLDQKQLLTDVSGAGNNWATGHLHFGMQYRDRLEECVRHAAEQCDCLQCFFLFHSLGGGTGSGVGTSILLLLQDNYPDIYRFVTAVYPSADDDVVTSPYNAVLAMHQLTEHADCVLPFENQALMDITTKFGNMKEKTDQNPYDNMNDIVGKMLLNITSSSRFEGALNVDLNEIATNLVPFPRMHYLVSSQTPLSPEGSRIPIRKLDQLFTDVFLREYQMIKADPRNSLYLSCALICRGKIELSDLRRNVDRLRPSLNFIHWNTEGWKTGLCSVAPVGQQQALVALSNNTCIHHSMQNLKDRFLKLYRRKAHIHHYTSVDGMDDDQFSHSLESLSSLIQDYNSLESGSLPSVAAPIIIAN
ncbi:tubulin epsilon chain-like [Anneissia japonica]|uniref:tubulin epsilon chain-like n=1 Tax=Anneissia japonica TaxID=1529436 RepID=UPI0014256D44|nr:tubulin epsilon chain-like [Anneissia japonica]